MNNQVQKAFNHLSYPYRKRKATSTFPPHLFFRRTHKIIEHSHSPAAYAPLEVLECIIHYFMLPPPSAILPNNHSHNNVNSSPHPLAPALVSRHWYISTSPLLYTSLTPTSFYSLTKLLSTLLSSATSKYAYTDKIRSITLPGPIYEFGEKFSIGELHGGEERMRGFVLGSYKDEGMERLRGLRVLSRIMMTVLDICPKLQSITILPPSEETDRSRWIQKKTLSESQLVTFLTKPTSLTDIHIKGFGAMVIFVQEIVLGGTECFTMLSSLTISEFEDTDYIKALLRTRVPAPATGDANGWTTVLPSLTKFIFVSCRLERIFLPLFFRRLNVSITHLTILSTHETATSFYIDPSLRNPPSLKSVTRLSIDLRSFAKRHRILGLELTEEGLLHFCKLEDLEIHLVEEVSEWTPVNYRPGRMERFGRPVGWEWLFYLPGCLKRMKLVTYIREGEGVTDVLEDGMDAGMFFRMSKLAGVRMSFEERRV